MDNSKKNSGKAPSFQFYYKDWLSENRLRGVSKIVKGVWIDLICISCDMPKPGIFRDENGPISEQKLVQMLDGNSKQNKIGFDYLKLHHILKKDESGCFYVKRIKEDTELKEKRRAAGRLGGNPNLVKDLDKQIVKQKTTPSARKKKMKKKKGDYKGGNIDLDKQVSPTVELAPKEVEQIEKRKHEILEQLK